MQAADINALFGFRIECIERLGDPHGIWAWTRLNALFNWLPLAACIEDKILCMHGGAYLDLLKPLGSKHLHLPAQCQYRLLRPKNANTIWLQHLQHSKVALIFARPDASACTCWAVTKLCHPGAQASGAASTAWTR